MIPVGAHDESQVLECISKDQNGKVTKTPLMGVRRPANPGTFVPFATFAVVLILWLRTASLCDRGVLMLCDLLCEYKW